MCKLRVCFVSCVSVVYGVCVCVCVLCIVGLWLEGPALSCVIQWCYTTDWMGAKRSFSCGHHFGCTHGLCDPAYRMSSTIFDHLDSCERCGHSYCNCNMRALHALRGPVHVDDQRLDSCEPNVRSCCNYSSMDRRVIESSPEQYGQCQLIEVYSNLLISTFAKWWPQLLMLDYSNGNSIEKINYFFTDDQA